MHNFIELFAGIGHPRVAFAGRLNCVYAVDFSKAKAAVYSDNFGDGEIIVKDIREIKEGELPPSGMWWVSSPCTDFTSAGKGAGMEGPQGALIFQTVRLLHACLRQGTAPSVVVMENVEGLVTMSAGAVFVALVTALVSAGYVLGAMMMDAADFLPQSRPRVFLVAVRRGIAIPAALVADSPTAHWHSSAIIRAVASLRSLEKENFVWWRLPVPQARQINLIDIVEPMDSPNLKWRNRGDVNHQLSLLGTRDRVRLKQARATGRDVYGTVANKPGKNKSRYLSLRTDGTAGCQMGKVDLRYQQFCRILGKARPGIRPATRIEMGRLMGLPQGFKLPASVAATAKACGDGVAVPVIEWLLTHLLEPLLEAADTSTTEKHAMDDAEDQARPYRSRTVTVRFEAGEHERAERYAAKAGVSLHEFLLRGMDRNLAEFGAAPVRRQPFAAAVPTRAKTAGREKSGESDIPMMAAGNSRRRSKNTATRTVRGIGARVAARSLLRGRRMAWHAAAKPRRSGTTAPGFPASLTALRPPN